MLAALLAAYTMATPGLFNWSVGDPNAYNPMQHGYKLDISAVPVAAFSADDGYGGGALGGFYWRDPKLKPYKLAIEGIVYLTNLAVHADGAYIDWLRVHDWPLRFVGGLFFWATRNDTYCGLGNEVRCANDVALANARALHLTPAQTEEYVRTYYDRRYISPSAEIKFFWQIVNPALPAPGDPKVELTFFWRGTGYIPGVLGHTVPYAQNYYSNAFPDGQPGFASVFQIGIMADSRDKEAAPTQGYWLDASVRGATRAWGSTWTYAGFNTTARTYLSFDARHAWVWANRFITDLFLGTPSVAEMSQIGGYATVPGGMQGFGGTDIGRGVRQNRYLGRIRVLNQSEVRWNFFAFDLFGEHFDLTAVAFADLAWVGVDYQDFGGDPRKFIVGEGGGLRVAWDEDFMLRLDAAVSDVENFGTRVYVSVDNVF